MLTSGPGGVNYGPAGPTRLGGAVRLLHPRIGPLPRKRPGAPGHRHLELPAVGVRGKLLDRVARLHRLPTHQGFPFPIPGVAREVAVRRVAEARVIDPVIRVALALAAVSQNPEPVHRARRARAVGVAHEMEAAGEPLAGRGRGHLAPWSHRPGLHFSDLG